MDSNDNCTPESRFMRAVILMMICTPEILNFILKSPRLRLLPVLSHDDDELMLNVLRCQLTY